MKPTDTTLSEAGADVPATPVQQAAPVQVSVIVPAFNAARTVVRAIDSVRQQRGVSFEVIVIDDGSTDDTAAVVRANIRPGEHIRLLQMPRNSGVSAARNTGIREARGDYLAFLDADDIWLPEKLSKQLAPMERNPGVSLVSCNSKLISAAGVPMKEGHVNRPPVQGRDAWKTLLMYNFIPTPTVLTRTALVRQVGGFDEALKVGEDLDLWIKLGIRGEIVVLNEILINYYDLAGSLMKRHTGASRAIVLPMLERHLDEQAASLTRSELRTIRGRQAFQIGCDIFFSKRYLESVPVFYQAFLCGERPLKSLTYIPRAILMELIRMAGRGFKRE